MSDKILSRSWWRGLLFKLFALITSNISRTSVGIPDNPERLLILAPVLRGDYLVLTPFITELRKKYPDSKLAIVVTKPSYELARYEKRLDRVFLYEKLPGWFLAIRRIIAFRPDIVFLPKTHPAFTESLLLMLTRSPVRIGINHPGHNVLLTHTIDHDDESEHRIISGLKLLQPLGIDISKTNRQMILGTTQTAEYKARNFFKQLSQSYFWISINLSASNPSRVWTFENWGHLIQKIHQKIPNSRFLVLSTPEDQFQCKYLSKAFDYVENQPTSSFIDAISFYAQTNLLISPDTGGVHGAIARGVPVVVLYNNERVVYRRFYPLTVPFKEIFPLSGNDVENILVQDVFKAAIELMDEVYKNAN